MSWILAGDIGGTKAHLALFTEEGGELRSIREAIFKSAEYRTLDALVQTFLGEDLQRVTVACLGVPGPVEEGRCETPNLPWLLEEGALQRTVGVPKLTLINDLVAMAYGIPFLSEDRFAVLNPGQPALGNRALIAAGTGLGEAILFWDGRTWHPSPSEGGHADFAPTSDLEIELLRYLNQKFGRTSYERVLSGPGLHNIYRFLKETGRGEEPGWLAERLEREDPAAIIAETALRGTSSLSVQALDLFVRIYGAEAGNLALKALARGGVYLGGGIAPKILPKLQEGLFMEAFTNKGRLSPLLTRIPVKVILDQKTALYGAARRALLGLRDPHRLESC